MIKWYMYLGGCKYICVYVFLIFKSMSLINFPNLSVYNFLLRIYVPVFHWILLVWQPPILLSFYWHDIQWHSVAYIHKIDNIVIEGFLETFGYKLDGKDKSTQFITSAHVFITIKVIMLSKRPCSLM